MLSLKHVAPTWARQIVGEGRGMAQLFLCTCKVCGKAFMAKRAKTEFCQDNSTCRVKWSRAQKKAQMEAEKKQLDMDTYLIYQGVVKQLPFMETALCELLDKHGKEPFETFIRSIAWGL